MPSSPDSYRDAATPSRRIDAPPASTAFAVPDEGWTRLRLAVALEGATLITLVLIAAPLKRLADLPELTRIMGPVHGLAFLFLVYVLIEAVSARMVGPRAALRLFVGALVPFGGVVNERWVARRMRPKGARA